MTAHLREMSRSTEHAFSRTALLACGLSRRAKSQHRLRPSVLQLRPYHTPLRCPQYIHLYSSSYAPPSRERNAYKWGLIGRLLPVSRRDTLHDQELSSPRHRALLSQRVASWHPAKACQEVAPAARSAGCGERPGGYESAGLALPPVERSARRPLGCLGR